MLVHEKMRDEHSAEEKAAYALECLWALAAGRHFTDKKGDPTIPRWSELTRQESAPGPEITRDDVKEKFRRLKRK